MSTAEEEAQERAVFEDMKDDDSDDDDAEDTDDDEDEESTPKQEEQQQHQPSSPPASAPPPPATSMASDELTFNTSIPVAAPSSSPAPVLQNTSPTIDITSFTPPAVITFASTLNGTIPIHNIAVAATAASEPSGEPLSSAIVEIEERKPPTISSDDSRRLFQRLWTDADEIKILRGFFEFTSKRGTTFASHQYDTGPFYEDIKKQINLEFTKNQLIEKIRRLKKKFRNCCSRMHSMSGDFQFKNSHERNIYEIAKNIWNPSIKRDRDSDDEEMMGSGMTPIPGNKITTVPINGGSLSSDQRASGRAARRRLRRRYAEETAAAAAAVGTASAAAGAGSLPVDMENSVPVMQTPLASAGGIPTAVEESLKICLSPLFKELINSTITGGPFASGLAGRPAMFSMFPFGLSDGQVPSLGAPIDEKWREQQILELEVYLKRVELVRDQIKRTLEDLKSSSS